MNSSHVIDPVFSIVAEPLARAGRARAFFPGPVKAVRRRPAVAPAVGLVSGPESGAGSGLLRLLERLRLCGAPRILRAECFLPESAAAPVAFDRGGRA